MPIKEHQSGGADIESLGVVLRDNESGWPHSFCAYTCFSCIPYSGVDGLSHLAGLIPQGGKTGSGKENPITRSRARCGVQLWTEHGGGNEETRARKNEGELRVQTKQKCPWAISG